MRWQQLIVDLYQRMSQEMEQVLDGLTIEDLHKRPAPGANPIGWLCWHVTRSLDRQLGDVFLGEQLWIKDGWHLKFNRPPNLNDTGVGHSDMEVDNLRISDVQTLLDYHRAVMDDTVRCLTQLSESDLDKKCASSQHPGTKTALHLRLVGTLNNLQHVGQAAYVRGLIKGHRWSGR
jgi:hypothetical protein